MNVLRLALVSCLFSSFAWANLFVGNGGEGVRLKDAIVVRDLYEKKIETPFIGDKTDVDLLLAVRQLDLLKKISVDTDLLARKLTDLNRVRTGLGNMVAAALQFYHFRLSGEEISLLPNDSNSVPDDLRVQLAVRRYREIMIASDTFRQLSEPQKVALLIHEGLYSLLKTSCTGSVCEQHSKEVRGIVGRLFLPDASMDQRLIQLIESRLEIPIPQQVCSHKPVATQLGIWNRLDTLVGSNLVLQNGSYWRLDSEFQNEVAKLCSALAELHPNAYFVSMRGELQFLNLRAYAYSSSFGMQQALRVKLESKVMNNFWADLSLTECQNRILSQSALFESLRSNMVRPADFCGH